MNQEPTQVLQYSEKQKQNNESHFEEAREENLAQTAPLAQSNEDHHKVDFQPIAEHPIKQVEESHEEHHLPPTEEVSNEKVTVPESNEKAEQQVLVEEKASIPFGGQVNVEKSQEVIEPVEKIEVKEISTSLEKKESTGSIPSSPKKKESQKKNDPVPQPAQANLQESIGKYFQKKIQEAIDLKNRGNQQFKNSQMDAARYYYQQALKILDPNQFYGASSAELAKMAELSASLMFNIGSCFFNSVRWREAQQFYTQAIIINKTYTKAIYKRALARYEMEKYEDAMTDIKLAFSLDKTNKEIYTSYEKILQKYNEEIRKTKQAMKQFSEKMITGQSTLAKKRSQTSLNAENQPQMEEGPSSWWPISLVLAPVAIAAIYFGSKLLRK